MIATPHTSGPMDSRSLPSYGRNIVRVIYDGSERMSLILECRIENKTV